ncbi:MAG: MFS transporter [Nanoarchaeota archaeon]
MRTFPKKNTEEVFDEHKIKTLRQLLQERKLKKEQEQQQKKEIPEYKKVEKTLSYSVKEGIANSVTSGLTTEYITPFAIAMNAGSSVIATLGAVPDFIGSLFQLFSIKLMSVVKSRKQLVLAATLLQALLWIPLLLIPYVSKDNFVLLISLVSLNATLTYFQSPIMNSLLGDIIPVNERGNFFGKRNRFVGLVNFISSFSAGLLLNHYHDQGIFTGFVIIFSFASFAKLISFLFKSQMHDPVYKYSKLAEFSLLDFIHKMRTTNFGKFVLFNFFFRISVSIASPFFALYMLRELKFNYLIFTTITVISIVTTFLSMGFWGKLIDNKGSRFVLYVSGIGIPLIPFLWLINQNYIYLIIVEAFSGLCWAGFNLAISSFMFDSTTPEKRVRCIAYYTLFRGVGIFIGALLGGYIISQNTHILIFTSIPLVFFLSGIGRFAVALYFLPQLKEVRLIELPFGKKHKYFPQFITIRHREGFEVYDSEHSIVDQTPKEKEKERKKLEKRQEKTRKQPLSPLQRLKKKRFRTEEEYKEVEKTKEKKKEDIRKFLKERAPKEKLERRVEKVGGIKTVKVLDEEDVQREKMLKRLQGRK